jgi:hypothetical protein
VLHGLPSVLPSSVLLLLLLLLLLQAAEEVACPILVLTAGKALDGG